MNEHESAKPCGCDAGANWQCEQHRGLGITNVILVDGLGDCIACDGYVISTSEAPYCPTCARLKREGKEP